MWPEIEMCPLRAMLSDCSNTGGTELCDGCLPTTRQDRGALLRLNNSSPLARESRERCCAQRLLASLSRNEYEANKVVFRVPMTVLWNENG